MINDILRELRPHLRRLHSAVRPEQGFLTDNEPVNLTPVFSPAQVRAMLRIEVDREREIEVMRDRDALTLGLRQQWQEGTGPLELEGVALYVVNRLPAPGWRVINPMDAK